MLKGLMLLTGDQNKIYKLILQGYIVINMDEDETIDLSKLPQNLFLEGCNLLPPIPAKQAEVDGNEQAYDSIYRSHLHTHANIDYITALIAYSYKGGNIVFYLPEIGYTNTQDKFTFFMFTEFGIHIGKLEASTLQESKYFCDTRYIPMWSEMLYMANIINPYVFLTLYPNDYNMLCNHPQIIIKLLNDIKPFIKNDKDFKAQTDWIYREQQIIKNKKYADVRPALMKL